MISSKKLDSCFNSMAFALYQILIVLRDNKLELSQECLDLLNALEDKYKKLDTEGSDK